MPQDEGQLAVVVAPVLRFMNVGFNADVRIEDIGDPEKVLNGFAPEILGGPVEPEDLVRVETVSKKLGGDPLVSQSKEQEKFPLLHCFKLRSFLFFFGLADPLDLGSASLRL